MYMKDIKRIAIIGNAGSGKSYLAQQLHTLTHLPIYHLDAHFWKPGWTRPDEAEYHKIHNSLCDLPEWIIDGMNLKYLEYRIQKADLVIYLDMPLHICFWRIFKRLWKYYGKQAPSSAPGCKEGLSWEFVLFLKWVWNFKRKHAPRVKELLAIYTHSKSISIFESPQEVAQFLQKLKDTY